MDELTQTRLVLLAVALAVALAWGLFTLERRRRDARFASLAQSFGCAVTRESEYVSRFAVEIDGKALDVRMQFIGGASSNPGTAGWRLVSELSLDGVSDLHSADIRLRSRRRKLAPSDAAEFDRHFEIRDAGYPLRDGWLTERMREAIVQFYLPRVSLEPLVIESSRLVHRAWMPKRFDGPTLRDLMARQVAVAKLLERTL